MTRKNTWFAIRGLVLCYLCLVVTGYAVLLLPAITTRPLTQSDALFTAISAVTLTGLQTCDFAGTFTTTGQAVVLFLIDAGAFTAIVFSLYLGWLSGRVSLFSDDQDLTNEGTRPWQAWKKIAKKTTGYLLFFEAICSGILYAFWNGNIPFTPRQKLHYAVFHGISVFTHSGFSNLEGNFSNTHVSHSFILLLALTGVMLLGTLGYAALFDLISLRRLRERMANPQKNWTLQTRVAIYSTAMLMVAGSITWFAAEHNRSLGGERLLEAVFASIFNVAGARGAGFYSVNIAALSGGMVYLYLILMIIGPSASSAGGGIKTSGLFFHFRKTIRINASYFGVFSAIVLIASILLLKFTDPIPSFQAIKFEVVSAFFNNGLSFGITPALSVTGKYILMADMLTGRVGLMVGACWLLRKKTTFGQDLLLI